MSWERLVRVAAPAVSPLSYEAAKAHLRLADDEDRDDVEELLEGLVAEIDGPRGWGICLIEQTWKLTLDAFACEIPIPLGPVISVDEVEYVAADGTVTVLDPSAWALAKDQDPAVLTPAYGASWPATRCERGAVRITFKSGFGAAAESIPRDLASCLKFMLRADYDGEPRSQRVKDIRDRYAVVAPA